jgi:hypothetical protein
MLTLLPLYFPNGRLLSPRWRPVAWLAVVGTVLASSFAALQPNDSETPGIPNPLGVEALRPFDGALSVAWPALSLILGLASVASLLVRFRRSRGEERQQIKWVAYAAVLPIAYLIVDLLLLRHLAPTASSVLGYLLLTLPYVTIAVAILKHRVYEIDLIINRTLVYGSLTAMLALFYFGSVTALQYLLSLLTGQGNTLAIVTSTLAIAALFSPLRRRIQGFIDRRFYRRKYDARKTLEAFASRLRYETDLERISEDLLEVVHETMQPSHISLWLRFPSSSKSSEGSSSSEAGSSNKQSEAPPQ